MGRTDNSFLTRALKRKNRQSVRSRGRFTKKAIELDTNQDALVLSQTQKNSNNLPDENSITSNSKFASFAHNMSIYHISELEPDGSTFGTPIQIKAEPELIIGENAEYIESDDRPLKKIKLEKESSSKISEESSDSNTESIIQIKQEPLEVDDEECSSNETQLTESQKSSDNEESSNNNFVTRMDTCEDDEFKIMFHMRRETVNYVIELYKNSIEFKQLKTIDGNQAKIEIYVFLWYLITNNPFINISTLFGVATQKIASILERVSFFLIHVGHNYVKWPTIGDSYVEIAGKMSRLKTGSGIIGTIECTLIKFQPINDKNKNMRGIYLQMVIDRDGYFVDVCCGEPGSYNIRDVLRSSSLYYRATKNESETFPDNTFIIGSTAYPSLNWLVTSFQGNLTDIQEQFNEIHSIKRTMAGKIVGGLKTRFRILQGFKSQKKLCSVVNITVCACILHNICVQKNDLWEGNIEPHKTVYIGREWPTNLDPVRDRRQKYLQLLIDNQQHNPLK